ncbi:MAG: DEAD/DEAH box helicase [Pseudomonadota bacterium]|nr:DEAD/DEAH box helicase [Pseudomonadota bacterium]
MSANTFSDFGLPESVVASLADRGITEAFPIQSMAIPPALDGMDVCGRAPTGSGKTLAFGIPLAQRVTRARSTRPRALILTPTRELAAQIREEMLPLLGPKRHSVATFYGGVGFGPQLKALRRGVEVAVACPGRLTDLVNRGNLKLDEVEFVVIDEADRMADMGFLPEVRRILDQVRSDRQTLLFSATLDGDVDVLIKRYQQDPVTCDVVPDEKHEDRTTHEFVRTRREDRVGLAAELATKHGSTVVFCRTKHGTDRVAKQLKNAGVSAVPIHGGRSQAQRDRALSSFANRRAQVLVATDVAARGIHVDDVGCVVHFDVPGDHKDYVHRSGRTGRAGAEGLVVSFVTEADVAKVRQLQRSLKMPLLKVPESYDDSNGGSRSNGSSGRGRGGGGRNGNGGGNRNRYRGGGNRRRSGNRNSRGAGTGQQGSRHSGGQNARRKQNAR